MPSDLLYKIALTHVPKIGAILAKELVAHCGSVEAIFDERKMSLLKIPGVGLAAATSIVGFRDFKKSEKELQFIERHKVKALFYLDDDYPFRLSRIRDAPIMLYYKGNSDLNAEQTIAIVGTRKPTDYGLEVIRNLAEDLMETDATVISGLAYGIDIAAHRAALQHGLETVGVLGSGLKRVYPSLHRNTARKMIDQGGLLTEFTHDTKPDREHFPMRNRIIAGLCDALVVVQSDQRGGSMITANLANGYHKDVFAIPGHIGEKMSRGPNSLIQTNLAHLLTSGKELIKMMNWERSEMSKPQLEIFKDLDEMEETIYAQIPREDAVSIDLLYRTSVLSPSQLAGILLNLEFKGLIRTLPGKMYRRCS